MTEGHQISRREFVGGAMIAPLTQPEIDLYGTAFSSNAQESFEEFRRRMRPWMIWSSFVHRLTRELEKFAIAYEGGKRPKLAISTPPQFGKSMAVEDLIAWLAGRQPERKTLYASYSEALGTRMGLNLRRTFVSRKYREVFPHVRVGVPGWKDNTDLIEFANRRGSFRATTIGADNRVFGFVDHRREDLFILLDGRRGCLRAMVVWQPMASVETRAPSRSSRSMTRMAVISLDFSNTAS
jgi:hypothetical protein